MKKVLLCYTVRDAIGHMIDGHGYSTVESVTQEHLQTAGELILALTLEENLQLDKTSSIIVFKSVTLMEE